MRTGDVVATWLQSTCSKRGAVPGTVMDPSQKRYLILAEEFSHDPHYGKTLRGVMRYRRGSGVGGPPCEGGGGGGGRGPAGRRLRRRPPPRPQIPPRRRRRPGRGFPRRLAAAAVRCPGGCR